MILSWFATSVVLLYHKEEIAIIFSKFTGKHLCQSLFFNKFAGQACNFIKKQTLAQVFSCEFCKIFKNTNFYRTPLVGASKNSFIISYSCWTNIQFWTSWNHRNLFNFFWSIKAVQKQLIDLKKVVGSFFQKNELIRTWKKT